MTIFEFRVYPDLPGRAFVKVDERFDVVIERLPAGLEIRVYPITAGDTWLDPYDTFKVDESVVAVLEKDMEG